MPIAIPTRGTAAAERCNAHRDAILVTLKQAGKRLTTFELADAIDATVSETGFALELLLRAGFVDAQTTPFKSRAFAPTHAAAVLS